MPKLFISDFGQNLYHVDLKYFSEDGSIVFKDVHTPHILAEKINSKKNLLLFPETAASPAELNAIGLINEISVYVVEYFLQFIDPEILIKAFSHVTKKLGKSNTDLALINYLDLFRPLPVINNTVPVTTYYSENITQKKYIETLITNLVIVHLSNTNPAFKTYKDLFDDNLLINSGNYKIFLGELRTYFSKNAAKGPYKKSLIEILEEPAKTSPNSLNGQLEFIIKNWTFLKDKFLYQLLLSLDILKEEQKIRLSGPGIFEIPDYSSFSGEEPERFSDDRDWMPNLVLIAKNSYVWLSQLSEKYSQRIVHLDQIPEEELHRLSQSGINGLWLIGIWERSLASARIKKLCGNAEAIASAYSLDRYEIAQALGGENAYQKLSEKAYRFGIRLASDMVPNHMGIDSDWVSAHPDWFVATDTPPFPAYSFNGENLSKDPNTGIFLEDHYYSRSDAAVVFKHVDYRSNQTRFIYHGNDGTSMPWNDTAQLNYLMPEVREAVYQTILQIARKFPVIRFDAAMTLTKRHYQRLWFPEPGKGGDIPSRAYFSMTSDKFNELFPKEFWREVVERISVEAPDTLLLAEAFWLMESYFVRTLGMHRVYNSAFMNLLRDEDNDKYRTVMKNTLEFDPEILKRYVNFMNNPDEKTAADQFGKGDKYFGICAMLATLPGLPMLGHGQVEGFYEKYGMEFYKAYWNEKEDKDLIYRHERDIFPILKQRYLFSGVNNFLLYDFYTNNGSVDENVFAYSNGQSGKRTLVVYHNKYGNTQGWIRTSASFAVKTDGSDEKNKINKSLYEGLNLHGDENHFVILKDHFSNLEFIRSSREIREKGLFFDLGVYNCHVFLDIYEVEDTEKHIYRRLHDQLNGRGTPSIHEKLFDLQSEMIKTPFQALINPRLLSVLIDQKNFQSSTEIDLSPLDEFSRKYSDFLSGIEQLSGYPLNKEKTLKKTLGSIRVFLEIPKWIKYFEQYPSRNMEKILKFKLSWINEDFKARSVVLYSWILIRHLGYLFETESIEKLSLEKFEEWRLWNDIKTGFADSLPKESQKLDDVFRLLRVMIKEQYWSRQLSTLSEEKILESWISKAEVQAFIKINRFEDVLWFNHESFLELLDWMSVLDLLDSLENLRSTPTKLIEKSLICEEFIRDYKEAEEKSEYQIQKLLGFLKI